MKVRPVGRPGDIDCSGDEPITKQEFAEESDINVIIARCLRGGGLGHVQSLAPVFADVSELGDFADCVRRVDLAREAFMLLPAEVRLRFGNSSVKLIEFLSDGKNYDEAVRLGLVIPRKKAEAPSLKKEEVKP